MAVTNQMSLNINVNDLEVKTCECGNTCFLPQLKVRFITRLLSPNGQPQYLITQEGICCAVCGLSFDLTNPSREEKDSNDEPKLIIVQ